MVNIFIEQLDLSEAVFDAPTRRLAGVVLIRAGESANKRRYTPAVLEKAVSVYENAPAYLNHDKPGVRRGLEALTGWYANVRYTGDALVADRYFARTPAGDTALGIAEDVVSGRAPRQLAGLSINAVGQASADTDGIVTVESIDYAHSVDDVLHPAAGGSYLEADGGSETMMTALLEAMTFEEWQRARTDFVERLKNEWKQVRQTDAVKALEAKLTEVQTALQEAQTHAAHLLAERDTAVAERTTARRELQIVEMLQSTRLPKSWRDDLRKRLMETEPDAWTTVVAETIERAKPAGLLETVPVRSAGLQEASELAFGSSQSIHPLPNEDVATWYNRVNRGQ
jgi:hypothetical protein